MKIILKFIIAIVFIVIILKACPSTSSYTPPDPTSSTTVSNDTSSLKDVPVSNWEYTEEDDAMTNKTIYYATCNSTNTLDFNFPYDGGSTLSIEVRRRRGKNEVILEISKGQFMSPYNSDVSIKFDDGTISRYGFEDAADGSSNYIFLNSPAQIIQKLKKAKHIKVQAPFYQEGTQVALFDVEGLVWKH